MTGWVVSYLHNDFGSSFSRCFCLSGHGTLQLDRQSDIFDFDSFHMDSPRIGCVVQSDAHCLTNALSFGQDFRQVLRAQYVSKRGGSEQAGRAVVVLDV